ncbi:universal stress protein [Crateriforma conspicua]|uniref:Putative universal stress protein n=1 Tax=Crateriforma conspicua TaxID=2527996 RepID=A0A5C6FY72_9PLAN|nr:universal stress protein [Crateriforma conspicua]TWU67471.1 putative universal stress protein [Crateriforma conspicua]
MKVLVAIDQSTHSIAALDQLAVLVGADQMDIELTEVVVPMPTYDFSGVGFPMDVPLLVTEQRDAVSEALNRLADQHKDQFRSIKTTVAVGPPGFELTRHAQESNADLIVTGAVGHSALERVLLGSVSDHVATHAECSALVTRSSDDASQGEQGKLTYRILIAVGNPTSDDLFLDWIDRIAVPESTKLHLVHVQEIMTFYRQDILLRARGYLDQAKDAASDHLEALRQKYVDKGFAAETCLVESEHVGRAIVEQADALDCQLVVTGDSHQSAWDRIVLGSVSRHVLHHSPTSVLIVR